MIEGDAEKEQCDVIRFVSMTSLGSTPDPDCRTSQSKGRYRAGFFLSRCLRFSIFGLLFWLPRFKIKHLVQGLFYKMFPKKSFAICS